MWHGTYTRCVTALAALADLAHPGTAIRERRIELGWTQAELARRSGVTQADISRIETCQLDARWSTISRLSVVLATTERPARILANGNRRVGAPAERAGTVWQTQTPALKVDR